jgi:prolipoprotein diacylglyceryltransferase
VVVASLRDGRDPRGGAATLAICAVAAVVGGRAWALLSWWAEEGEAARWIWDPFSPAGYASAGALVGAALVVLLHRVMFGSEDTARVLDAVAPAGFAALALTRVGCLFEGCDVGRIAHVRWAVRYPHGHPVFDEQVAAGLVDEAARWSAAVHPFALYLAVPTLLIALASIALRSPRAGARAAWVGAGYGVVRLGAEAFRAPGSGFQVGYAVALFVLLASVAWWFVDRR